VINGPREQRDCRAADCTACRPRGSPTRLPGSVANDLPVPVIHAVWVPCLAGIDLGVRRRACLQRRSVHAGTDIVCRLNGGDGPGSIGLCSERTRFLGAGLDWLRARHTPCDGREREPVRAWRRTTGVERLRTTVRLLDSKRVAAEGTAWHDL
jgi:hypothetical protein